MNERPHFLVEVIERIAIGGSFDEVSELLVSCDRALQNGTAADPEWLSLVIIPWCNMRLAEIAKTVRAPK